MAQCPACQRPVAIARPTCLYCGAPLSQEAVAAAARAAAALEGTPRPPSSDRTLLVVDWEAASPAAAGALDLPPFEAELRRRRGGLGLESVLPVAQAEEEAARLRAAGLRVFLVPEVEARVVPWMAVAGSPEEDGLRVRGEGEVRHLRRDDLLLVVQGPIVREYQARIARRKVETAGLEGGYRFHLHLKATPIPLELDPGELDLRESGRLSGSSLLEVRAWVEGLGVAVDDGFRSLTPALGPAAAKPDPASIALQSAVVTRRPRGEATVLDNLGQFRYYSAWRAAVERQRVG